MLTKKKKIIIICVMVALLAVTGYLNIALNNDTITAGSSNVTTGNFFATYRNDRQSTRDQELLYYDAIIASETASTDAKNSAQTSKEKIISAMEVELVTEGLIKAKGFEDVIVTSTTGCVNIIVKSAELSTTEVAQIVEIVKQQTGESIDNIRIIPVE